MYTALGALSLVGTVLGAMAGVFAIVGFILFFIMLKANQRRYLRIVLKFRILTGVQPPIHSKNLSITMPNLLDW
jgi:uncharacterized membrane protein